MTAKEYRSIRQRLGLQREVADMLGVCRFTIIKREKGDPIPKEAQIAIQSLDEEARRKKTNDTPQ